MITPAINCLNSVTCKGKVIETEYLKNALKTFTSKELAEYEMLKKMATKIPDKKEFLLFYLGCKEVKVAEKSKELSYTAGLWEKLEGKFLKQGVYSTAYKYGNQPEVSRCKDNLLAEIILTPLRELYKKV